MKYPQLVSTRAVNAISDWLVSRLEQLGVEAPLIYSRLLLSLLHSSVQINDPIEFNNLETYLTSRKGNKKNPPCDTDTLKKIAAVQCLMETVSSEQEIAKIENLVDELCEKLNDIEKQINTDEEQHFQAIENILNSLASGNNCIKTSTSINNQNIANINSIPSTSGAVSISISKSSINSNCNISVKTIQSESFRNNNINNKSDIEDPRKRYYSAFPALSKEMEDSFRNSSRNTKALTWPVSKSSSLQIINNTNIINNKSEIYKNTAGVKRKPKRRRNQAMSKGRTSYNLRKKSFSGNGSPTWDTDFEGSWEMGRDLIKEFIVKENNRNRSTSESAAYNIIDCSQNDFVNEKRMKPMDDDNEMENYLYIDLIPSSSIKNQQQLLNIDDDDIIADISIAPDLMKNKITSTTMPVLKNIINISSHQNCNGNLIGITTDEGYSTHENLTSLSELDANINYTRRLYERDISNDEDSSTSMNLCSNIEQQQYDFAQFKAKFNSSVEALWKNNENETKNNNNEVNRNKSKKPNESISFKIKNEKCLKMNVENFWTNYYNHHYDAGKINDISKSPYNDDIAIKKEYENEYFSKPNNMVLKSGASNGFTDNITAKTKETKRLLLKIPSGIFLQDSIWSDLATNYDDDDSFYANVLKSSYKNDVKNFDDSLNNDKTPNKDYPINNSKWSEGINGVSTLETSFIPIQLSVKTNETTAAPSSEIQEIHDSNRKDLRENMLKNSYFYNNNIQQQSQPQQNFTNIKTFYHNYAMSPPPAENIYYNASESNNENMDQSSQHRNTLPNHSDNSGFVEYSLIKSLKKDSTMINIFRKPNIDSSTSSSSCLYGSPLNISTSSIEEENLLTSDRTHFRPIKQTYADGYTFDISNNYDEIDYKRSPSGYLHYDGDKYLEYKRSELMPTIEDVSLKNINTTKSSGKYQRHSGNSHTELLKNSEKKKEQFILKFQIKSSNEKGCQTDIPIPIIDNNNSSEYYFEMGKCNKSYQININNFEKFKNDYEEECNIEDIELFDNNYYSNKLSNTSDIMKKGQIPTGNEIIDQWSMIEIGKKCIDNISSNFHNSNNNSSHTLWGLCPACNIIDAKSSIPANRLLKDELNIEADEIMSDLKYMQDLYIGGGSASDWDDNDEENDDDDTDFGIEIIKDCDYYQSTNINNIHNSSSDNIFISQQNKFNNNNNNIATAMITEDDEQLQKEMFYNVTKLITDFLKPENVKTLANALVGDIEENQKCLNQFFGGGTDIGCTKTENETNNNNQENKYSGGLWNNEHNIWKQSDYKPIDNMLMRLNNNTNYINNNNNINIESTKDCDDKINWEFSNLADIWHKNTSPQKDESVQEPNINFTTNKMCLKNLQKHYRISSGQINEIKQIEKMDNDDEEILNKLDEKISKNISQENYHQFSEQQNHKHQNFNNKNIFKQKSIQIHQHSQSLDDSVTMNINKDLNSNILKNQNRFDRKRRHSAASQNIIITTTTTTTTTINDIIKSNSNNKYDYKNHNNIIVDGGGKKYSNYNNNNDNNNKMKSSICGNTKNFFDNLIIGNNQNIDEILSSTKDLLNYGNKFNSNDDYIDDNDNKDISPTSATIITCKYWTTKLDPVHHKTATFYLDNKNRIGTGTGSIGECYNSFVVDSSSNVCCNSDDDNDDGGGIGSVSINPSSILKHVALIARPLTR